MPSFAASKLSTLSTISAILLLLADNVISTPIYGWGYNDYGQLGIGNTVTPVRYPTLVSFYSSRSVTSMSMAASYHVAADNTGAVYASGNNFYGCLGLADGNTGNYTTPLQNRALTGCSVAITRRAANAVCSNNLYGWGFAAGFTVGATSGYYKKVQEAPTSNVFGNNVNNVYVVDSGVFVNYSSGVVVAGTGAYGKLALGNQNNTWNFQKANFFTAVPPKKMYNSQTNHSCYVAQNESLFCWGDNDDGQLGVGDYNARSLPTRVTAIEEGEYYVAQVAFGTSHTVALSCGGVVLTWGTNQFGALGNSGQSNGTSPQVITGIPPIVEIAASSYSTFARTATNDWYTWGAGYGGILGTNNDIDQFAPVHATLLSSLNITRIFTGASARSAFGSVGPTYTVMQNCPVLVDNCVTGNNCDSNATCIETDRFHLCQCNSGYRGDGFSTASGGSGCTDINECAEGTDSCSAQSTCVNVPGSYYCTCNSGYYGNGYTSSPTPSGGTATGCTPTSNACTQKTSNCSPNANCTAQNSGYTCSCNSGYSGNGTYCGDVNECAGSTNPCAGNGNFTQCVNTIGSYTCGCPSGYQNTNGSCTDINECANSSLNACNGNGNCTNTPGSYTCACRAGFAGNGTYCTPVASSTTSSATVKPSGTTTNGIILPATPTPTPSGSTTGSASGSGSTSGFGGNTNGPLDNVQTIQSANLPVQTAASTSGSSGSAGNGISAIETNNNQQTTSVDSQEAEVLVGVLVAFIVIIVVAVAVIVIFVIKYKQRTARWV